MSVIDLFILTSVLLFLLYTSNGNLPLASLALQAGTLLALINIDASLRRRR